MSATPEATEQQREAEFRNFLNGLRNDLDTLRGAQTATAAVLHAVLATHQNPEHCEAAVAQLVQQLKRDSAGWPERSLQAMDSTIAALRTTIDHNRKHREKQQAGRTTN